MKNSKSQVIQYKGIDCTERHIAIQIAKGMPIEGKVFAERVNSLELEVKRLPKRERNALKIAVMFSHRVAGDDRADAFQEFYLELHKHKTSDVKLQYAIVRSDWKDYLRKAYIRSHYGGCSLESEITDEEGNTAYLSDLIVGEVEFESKQCALMDAESVFKALPKRIKKIVKDRMYGHALKGADREALSHYVKKTPMIVQHSN